METDTRFLPSGRGNGYPSQSDIKIIFITPLGTMNLCLHSKFNKSQLIKFDQLCCLFRSMQIYRDMPIYTKQIKFLVQSSKRNFATGNSNSKVVTKTVFPLYTLYTEKNTNKYNLSSSFAIHYLNPNQHKIRFPHYNQ